MSKFRDLECITFDLAKVLGIYKDSYAGSPFKERAEQILSEYTKFLSHWDGLRNQKVDSWGELESKIASLLYNERDSLSDSKEKAKEIMETVKCLRIVQDDNDKLEAVASFAKSLKSKKSEGIDLHRFSGWALLSFDNGDPRLCAILYEPDENWSHPFLVEGQWFTSDGIAEAGSEVNRITEALPPPRHHC